MSSGEKRCTEPDNQKKRDENMIRKVDESINPYVTVKGNILVSGCCGAEMLYKVSDKYGFGVWDFCPYCLECCDTLEVKENFDREIYLDKYDNFEFDGYDKKNFEIIPKCHSETYTEEELKTKCFYCKTSTSEIQGHKVGLLSFNLKGYSIGESPLIIKACEDCYFTNEEELEEIAHKDDCKCQYCEVL